MSSANVMIIMLTRKSGFKRGWAKYVLQAHLACHGILYGPQWVPQSLLTQAEHAGSESWLYPARGDPRQCLHRGPACFIWRPWQ